MKFATTSHQYFGHVSKDNAIQIYQGTFTPPYRDLSNYIVTMKEIPNISVSILLVWPAHFLENEPNVGASQRRSKTGVMLWTEVGTVDD